MIAATATVPQARALAEHLDVRDLPVMEGERLVGMLTFHQLCNDNRASCVLSQASPALPRPRMRSPCARCDGARLSRGPL